jgi:hypothetical protein
VNTVATVSVAVPPAVSFGSAVGVLVGMWWQRRHSPVTGSTAVELPEDGLSAADREAIAAEFAVHATAVAAQVSQYADALADGDVLLRERLRQVEQHLHREN